MSKHPTSELSPRDIAAMDYGHQYMIAINAFRQRNFVPRSFRRFIRDEIKLARYSRAYIFRYCTDCLHCDIEAMSCNEPSEYPRELTWQYEDACTCPHYKERGGE